jgi:hypothetical protein
VDVFAMETVPTKKSEGGGRSGIRIDVKLDNK